MGCPDTGDGRTTFALPGLRGYFLRGLDLGAGRDSDRTLGSVQDSQNKAHAHAASARANGNHVHSVWTGQQAMASQPTCHALAFSGSTASLSPSACSNLTIVS